ncbi:hypothetical protein [Nocardioides montaniterrae]
MSVKRVDCFTVVCDWHGCGATVCDESDYSGWDVDGIEVEVENAIDAGWHQARDRGMLGLLSAGTVSGEHYCHRHPAAWASDAEQVASMTPPYLLIHDGDTEDPDDDGRVTLVLRQLEDPRQQPLAFGVGR